MRRLIYTTNAIEGFNRQLRKVTKAKSVFPTDDSLLKMLYLAMVDITKKWTGRRQDWSVIHAQLSIDLCRTHARIAGRRGRTSRVCAPLRGAPMNGGLAVALTSIPAGVMLHASGSRINPLPHTLNFLICSRLVGSLHRIWD